MTTLQQRRAEAVSPKKTIRGAVETPRAIAPNSRRPAPALNEVILNHTLLGARSVLMATLTVALEARYESTPSLGRRDEQIAHEVASLARRIEQAVSGGEPAT